MIFVDFTLVWPPVGSSASTLHCHAVVPDLVHETVKLLLISEGSPVCFPCGSHHLLTLQPLGHLEVGLCYGDGGQAKVSTDFVARVGFQEFLYSFLSQVA